MKVAFVSTSFDQVPQEYQGSREAEEPLDVMYAINAARASGCDARLVDVWAADAGARLVWADAIVFSTTNSYLQWNNHPLGLTLFEKVWKRVWSVLPPSSRPKTVVFGPHVPSSWKELYALGADAVLLGEAELSVTLAARTLVHGAALDEVPGMVRKDGARLGAEAVVDQLDDLPCPAWDQTVGRDYNAHNHPDGPRSGHLYEGSRGCPFLCSYCNTITHRRTFRTKSAAKIERDLAHLAEISTRDYVYFIDESFGAKDRWVDDLAPRLKGLMFSFGCQGNLKFMSRRKLDQLREAGFISIEFGFETADMELIRRVGKDNKMAEACDLINYAASIDMNPLLFTLVGLPGEDKETLAKTVAYFRTLSPRTRISVAMPTPYLDTALYKLGRERGIIEPETKGLPLYEHSGRIGHDLEVDLARRTSFLSTYGPNNKLESEFIDRFERDLGRLFSTDARA